MSTGSMSTEARRVMAMTPDEVQLSNEIDALAVICDRLSALNQVECARVIEWARDRFVDHRPKHDEDVR